jgi:salicylate hydroxylase
LTAALALAAKGMRVIVYEQSEKLVETGAGIQLAPNATRILSGLKLADSLRRTAVVPEAISVRTARNGEEIVRIPLGQEAEFRYGAPYWLIHRADLQAALFDAASEHPDIVMKLGARVEDFAVHGHGLTAQVMQGRARSEERGLGLVAADGLWSSLRVRLGHAKPPRFQQRTAWRALLRASELGESFRAPVIHLWLGRDAHLVHYPVRGGTLINLVAIVHDRWQSNEWNAPGPRDDILRRFRPDHWHSVPRSVLAKPEAWQRWAIYDRPPDWRWGTGPVTLLGDAAHPIVPFLAQGAAMAIEDAAVVAQCLAKSGEATAPAMRQYEGLRQARTRRVQRAALSTGQIYHKDGPAAFMRDMAMKMMGGTRLRARYDWLYDWRSE